MPELLAASSIVGQRPGDAGHVFDGRLRAGPLPEAVPPEVHADRSELDKLVAEAKFDNWVSLFKFKNNWRLNPDLPVSTPWKTVHADQHAELGHGAEPVHWVDTEGNQLPYIDKIQLTLAENLEVLNLRAIAGEYDYQARHIDIGKLPVFIENQQKGNYKV